MRLPRALNPNENPAQFGIFFSANRLNYFLWGALKSDSPLARLCFFAPGFHDLWCLVMRHNPRGCEKIPDLLPRTPQIAAGGVAKAPRFAMIGRHVARYTPRFRHSCALPVTFGQSCYNQDIATAGGFFRNLRKTECPTKQNAIRNAARSYLLDFRFFIQNMLPEHRVELFDFHFPGRGLFILGRCIKMSRPSAGNQPDFISRFAGH
ncbi:MAG: hypothetical protein BECKG1743D_GA0114223_108202 [Candidatus Kentron sp. G]|nr:MAG: hypothetical protein BECKG1743F_GA0114225_108254 [Candidatus Kentron sp. G]VFN04934.1 MAG: hypothetical protein BECKG1743E_GA0114224_107962 [Candidatus Kentron sp. G]VFN06149.1 MAG: hypothetical protein BECKG1743D_GA0114223_108202 [Candidatus Kentron sp. G]